MKIFIGKTLVTIFAILFTLWIIKINHLEPGLRVRHSEYSVPGIYGREEIF